MLNVSFVSHLVWELRLTKYLRRHSRFRINLGSKHRFSDERYGVFKFPRIYESFPSLILMGHPVMTPNLRQDCAIWAHRFKTLRRCADERLQKHCICATEVGLVGSLFWGYYPLSAYVIYGSSFSKQFQCVWALLARSVRWAHWVPAFRGVLGNGKM